MPASYKQVPLEDATAGMVLSDNLLDGTGKILLPKGATLTDRHLASLQRHGMETIPVACEAACDGDAQAELAQRLERIDRLFRRPADNMENANDILMQHVRYYRQQEQP